MGCLFSLRASRAGEASICHPVCASVGRLGNARPEVWHPLCPRRPWSTQLSWARGELGDLILPFRLSHNQHIFFHRAYGVVSMCIGTGMGAAAVFEYPGN